MRRFRTEFRGRDVFAYQQIPRSGIRHAAILEWALAAHWWGMAWEDFCERDGDDQAFYVAVYRTKMQIDAVTAWWQAKQRKR